MASYLLYYAILQPNYQLNYHFYRTRPVLGWFQDCCKDWSLNPGFCFYGYKKDVMVIMSLKAQTQIKLIEEKHCSRFKVLKL